MYRENKNMVRWNKLTTRSWKRNLISLINWAESSSKPSDKTSIAIGLMYLVASLRKMHTKWRVPVHVFSMSLQCAFSLISKPQRKFVHAFSLLRKKCFMPGGHLSIIFSCAHGRETKIILLRRSEITQVLIPETKFFRDDYCQKWFFGGQWSISVFAFKKNDFSSSKSLVK